MLIRSQDKKFIVKMDSIAIQATEKGVICFSTSDIESDSYIRLGNYSTEEKSFKVLDMIQEAYINGEVAEILAYGLRMVPTKEITEAGVIIKNAIQNSTVFQMPADSEVEV